VASSLRHQLGLALVICAAGLAQCAAASASSVTLGETATAMATGSVCAANVFETMADPATPSYTVPTGGGAIVSWSTATFAGAHAGSPITLLALVPSGGSNYKLAGFDSETLPTPLPTDNLATFAIPTGIEVPAGTILGLSSTATTEECDFTGDPDDSVYFGTSPAPAQGAIYARSAAGSGSVNVSADLVQTVDAGLTVAAPPVSTLAGGVAAFSFSLSNTGSSSGRMTVFDNVPKGLSVLAAISGSGSCVTSGQIVTCTTEPLVPRSTTPISIVVKTSAPGSFTDTATAASSLFSDPNTANNVASADLAVTRVPTAAPGCHIVGLKGVRLRTAKSVLLALSCAVGKVSKKASKSVAKGDVISTSPGSGSRPAGSKIAIVESSGKPKRKHARG
jgi:hypothetical protein